MPVAEQPLAPASWGCRHTLQVAEVPPAMGGAAGAALQTGQRIGSSLGAALLITVYEVAKGPLQDEDALRASLLTSLLVLSAALAMAYGSLRAGRRQTRDDSEGVSGERAEETVR